MLEEKLKVAHDTIFALESELLKRDSIEEKLALAKDKAELRNLQLCAKIEVYQDVIEALIKELRGDK